MILLFGILSLLAMCVCKVCKLEKAGFGGLVLVGLRRFSPFCSVVGDFAPLGEVKRQVVSFECLVDCAAPLHLRCSYWPYIVHPSRQINKCN